MTRSVLAAFATLALLLALSALALAQAPGAGPPMWLLDGWLRVTPPAGWEALPESTPELLRFSNLRESSVRLRAETDRPGTTLAEQLRRLDELENWNAANPRPVRVGEREWVEVAARREGRPDRVVAATEHAGRLIVLTCDGPGIPAWYRAGLFTFVAPVPGCRGMVGVPGTPHAAPLPLGFHPEANGSTNGVQVAHGETTEGRVRLLVAVVPVPDAPDLDAAFGPLERRLEDAHGLVRTSGHPLELDWCDAFLAEGSIGPPSDAARRFTAVWCHDAARRELVLVLLDHPVNATAVRPLLLERILPGLWHPPVPLPPVARIELSGEWLDTTGDGEADIAQLNVVFLDAEGRLLQFTHVPFTVQWQLVDGRPVHRSNAVPASRSSATLAGGELAAMLQVPPRLWSRRESRAAEVRVVIQIDGLPAFRTSAALRGLLDES